MNKRSFYIIAAMDEGRGLGQGGELAWVLPADLKHFKKITTTVKDPSLKNALIMGRKTWESLPEKYRPLPGRINIVLTQKNNLKVPVGVQVFDELDACLRSLSNETLIDDVFVIGGAKLYDRAIFHPSCKGLFLTHLKGFFPCDVFFPSIPSDFKIVKTSSEEQENGISYSFNEYLR